MQCMYCDLICVNFVSGVKLHKKSRYSNRTVTHTYVASFMNTGKRSIHYQLVISGINWLLAMVPH